MDVISYLDQAKCRVHLEKSRNMRKANIMTVTFVRWLVLTSQEVDFNIYGAHLLPHLYLQSLQTI